MERLTLFTIYEQFHLFSVESPHKPALYLQEKFYSYSELMKLVEQYVIFTRGHHVKCIGILASRSLEAYIGILTASYLGAAYVPLSPEWPDIRLSSVIHQAEIDTLIVDTARVIRLSSVVLQQALPNLIITPDVCNLNTSGLSHPKQTSSSLQHSSMSPDGIAYIMFTSGSTGEPKGVPVSVANFSHYINAMQKRYQLTPDDRVVQFTQLTFDLSQFDITMAWNAGACLYVVPESQLLAPAKFIRDHEITIWFSVPSIIGFMSKLNMLKPNTFPSLRYSLFCGEALKADYAELWKNTASNSIVENLYGPTEVTVTCLAQTYHGLDSITQGRDTVAIGIPNPGMLATIIDENSQFLSPKQIGELVLSGPQVVTGYWKKPDITIKKFIELNHPKYGLQRWYRTGDQCYQDENGVFHYLGRIDNQYKVQGYRIEIEEVEHYLRKASECHEVGAVVIPSHNGVGSLLIGVICTSTVNINMVKERLKEMLPHYMIPERIVVSDGLPFNIHGKLDRKALQASITNDYR